MTLKDTTNATSSPASVDGATPSALPGGLTTDLFGQALVPASPSQPQGNGKGIKTHVISGPSGFGSSASAALQSSLASRLQQRLDGVGSTLYRLTWKDAVTPSGRRYSRLQASVPRTNGTDCGSSDSWPTPASRDHKGAYSEESQAVKPRWLLPDAAQMTWLTPTAHDTGRGYKGQLATEAVDQLKWQAQLAAWPTPKEQNSRGPSPKRDGLYDMTALTAWPTPRTPTGGPESAERKQELGRTDSGGGDLQAVALSAWPTARAEDAESAGTSHSRGIADTLTAVSALTPWPTPNAGPQNDTDQNWEKRRAECKERHGNGNGFGMTLGMAATLGPTSSGSPAGTEKPGQLNPAFSLWLMGYPNRVGLLRGAGNAIVPQVAAAFIEAYCGVTR